MSLEISKGNLESLLLDGFLTSMGYDDVEDVTLDIPELVMLNIKFKEETKE